MPNNYTSEQAEGASNEKLDEVISLQMHKDILAIERHRFEYEKSELIKHYQEECDKLKAEIKHLNKVLYDNSIEIKKKNVENKNLKSVTDEKIKELKKHARTYAKPGSKHDINWKNKYNKLKIFKQRYGHCNVTKEYVQDYKDIGLWVNTQRVHYKLLCDGKKSCMTSERIQLLNSINFVWGTTSTTTNNNRRAANVSWDIRFEQLKQYKSIHGHVRVPQKIKNPHGLGNFVLDQRRHYREFQNDPENYVSCLTIERIQLLESIGFEWSLRNRSSNTKNNNSSNNKSNIYNNDEEDHDD